MKFVTIIGARPQFIKAAMLSREIELHPEIQEVIIHTGQHFDTNMSALFFQEMGMHTPNYNLDLHSLPHGALTGRMMEQIELILQKEQPDAVIVYGDTDSTLAGALTTKKLHIPLIHIEAGLRSFNMSMPEEINRIVTDRIADLLFCPTQTAIDNLRREGIEEVGGKIIPTGDLMKDAAQHFAGSARRPDTVIPETFALCTLHRAENTDNPAVLQSLIQTLEKLCSTIPIVLPLHPRTRKLLTDLAYSFADSPIRFIEPVGYLEMLYLLQHCRFVLTDSGGLQKEAFFFQKYCLTLRNETEWVELVQNGYNAVVGHDSPVILKKAQAILNKEPIFDPNMYGDGHSAQHILHGIIRHLEATIIK